MNAEGTKKYIKSQLSKLIFFSGRNPIIIKKPDDGIYIPEPYKSVLLVSADFELAWASRYNKKVSDPLRFALTKARTERGNIPLIIDILAQYNIPITWATTGHLFLESCQNKAGQKHPEIPRVNVYKGIYWDFKGTDWFEHDPCTDYKTDNEWYAPDLIEMILKSPVNHEIGCHSFSHIDCRDNVCSPELFRAELTECKRLAREWGILLKSFVHPGHTIGNLDVLAEEGFSNFRTDYQNVLGFPRKHANGLWEFEQTTELAYRKEWSVKYHIYRYKEIIKRAIKSNTLCIFWFHPSSDFILFKYILPEVLKFINENRKNIWLTTHGNYAEWLDSMNFRYK